MSYADAAAKGPKQSLEDARAPYVGGVYKDDAESTASLIDVDSPHVTAVDPKFLNQDVQTTTQADRLEREAEDEEKAYAQEESRKNAKARNVKSSSNSSSNSSSSSLSANTDNPVYIGNAVLYTLVGAGLGFGAYRKHAEGKLSWELVGLWSGAVGALGVADYFVSKWFLQNKYPPK